MAPPCLVGAPFTHHSARCMETAVMPLSINHQLVHSRLRTTVAVIAIALASSACAARAVAGQGSTAALSARVVELVNAARGNSRSCGAERFSATSALRVAPQLNDAAAHHARDMARRKYFDHRGSDGSQPKDRVIRAGYLPSLTGENIAFGPESAEEVVAGWLASPGHCANIMDARFKHIGVAVATGRNRKQIYWVQESGAPRPGR